MTFWIVFLVFFSDLWYTGSTSRTGPNIVLIFADDLGFGDLGCYGHPTSITPNPDTMAANGLRFTDFYSASPVCSPSRAALLTGRYQTRSGVYPGVFYPGSKGGLPLNETTIAEVLKPLGYATAMVGKWHLGIGANGSFLPVYQGFDHYLGVPYSHDQGPCQNLTCFPPDTKCYGMCDQGAVLLPLFFNNTIIQQPHTHYPQFASALTAGKSLRGRFGDALMEFDTSVGVILETLEASGIQNNTFVFFTSDNGVDPEERLPVKFGQLYFVFLHVIVTSDKYLLLTCMSGLCPSMRKTMFYYPVDPSIKLGVFAVRYGKYKAHYYTRGSSHSETTPDHDCHIIAGLKAHEPPLLFDLESDPSENYNLMVYDYQPEYDLVLKKLQELKAQFEETMVFGESQIGKGSDDSLEPCCNPQCTPKPACCSCIP
ncbi:UNVERIFIED_CONTAM: hypothetical protein FKN15_036251 [Acipenser sinensis]